MCTALSHRLSVAPLPWVGQSGFRAPALAALSGRKGYSGPRSPLSLCRDQHDTVCVLNAVSGAALQTQTVPGTLVHSRLAPARHGCQQVSHQPLGLAARLGHGAPSRAERTSSLLESLESPVARARSDSGQPLGLSAPSEFLRLDETGHGFTGGEKPHGPHTEALARHFPRSRSLLAPNDRPKKGVRCSRTRGRSASSGLERS